MTAPKVHYRNRFGSPWYDDHRPKKSVRVECLACGQEYPTARQCPMCGAPALLTSANDAEIPDEFRAIARKAI